MSTEEAVEPQELDRHECRACGYIYEPDEGDARGKVPPGTPFEELPVTWRCPVCSARVQAFSNIGPKGGASGFKENYGYGLGVNSLTPAQKNLLIFGGLLVGGLFLLSFYGLQ